MVIKKKNQTKIEKKVISRRGRARENPRYTKYNGMVCESKNQSPSSLAEPLQPAKRPFQIKSSQVKFLLSTQIQNSPPLVPGAGSLRRSAAAVASACSFSRSRHPSVLWMILRHSSLFPFSSVFYIFFTDFLYTPFHGANYPHQALKGGYFVFVWRVGT